MDYEKARSELDKISDLAYALWNDIRDTEENEIEQKSKKTGKWDGRFTCKLRLLYATRKYGCSGIEGEAECLLCGWRR